MLDYCVYVVVVRKKSQWWLGTLAKLAKQNKHKINLNLKINKYMYKSIDDNHIVTSKKNKKSNSKGLLRKTKANLYKRRSQPKAYPINLRYYK